MIKAMRECLKNWLIQNERLYWYIVIGLAVFGFGLATAMGCAKLHNANAADETTFVVPWGSEMVEVSNEGYPYYFIFYDSYNKTGNTRVMFSREPLTGGVGGYYTNGYECILRPVSGTYVDVIIYGWGGYAEGRKLEDDKTYKTLSSSSGYDSMYFSNYYSNYAVGNLPANPYEPPKEFSSLAPYVQFDSLNVRNDMAVNDGYLFIEEDLYADFIKTAYWQYNGVMQNADAVADLGYKLEVDFVVELPTDAYIESLYDSAGVSMTKESNLLKYASKAVSAWYGNDNAPKRTYKFTYLFDVMLNENGQFSYELSFEEILTLIKYFNNETIEMFNGYDKDYLALLLSFMHVDRVDTVVLTERLDSKLYGAITTNKFERGVFDASFEVISLLDRETIDESELENMIQWDLEEQYNSYVKDLEDKLNDMQNQIDQMGSVDGAFSGDLDTSDLWTSFRSIIAGFASFIPSITFISLLAGSVFAFLPSAISGIIMATVLAVCIIAIIKAIK